MDSLLDGTVTEEEMQAFKDAPGGTAKRLAEMREQFEKDFEKKIASKDLPQEDMEIQKELFLQGVKKMAELEEVWAEFQKTKEDIESSEEEMMKAAEEEQIDALSALDAAFLQQEEAGLENPVESSSSKKQQDELAAYVGLAQVASVLVEKFEMEPEKALEMVKAKVRELKETPNSDARLPMEKLMDTWVPQGVEGEENVPSEVKAQWSKIKNIAGKWADSRAQLLVSWR
jgi:hypothetical protein